MPENNLEAALEEAGNEEWAIDFSAEKDRTPLPPDTYLVKVEKATHKIAKSEKKTPMVALQLSVVSGEHKGRKLFCNLHLAGGATWRTRKNMKAFGVTIEGDAPRLSPNMVLDKEVLAVVSGKDPEWPDSVDELLAPPAGSLADA